MGTTIDLAYHLPTMPDTCCGTHLCKGHYTGSGLYSNWLIFDSPETVESLFIAYRLTGDEIYREHGWKIFQAIEKHARVPTGGYATVLNVDENPAQLEDKMETFFLVSILTLFCLLCSLRLISIVVWSF